MKEDVIECFLSERTGQRGMQNLCALGWGVGKSCRGKEKVVFERNRERKSVLAISG